MATQKTNVTLVNAVSEVKHSDCSFFLFVVVFLSLTTTSSSITDSQTSCWKHDLPLVPDAIPTISKVIPGVGWWLPMFMIET